ncbi:hypothetical protein PHK61_31440 [Actinomycetospora lutea]|uniref:hypothetical protein n=1 Tax=Actinomycetospora lutea TaxID=663604 RepID=UPI0023654B1F|nr:hypothetical protein [Actinomycetospora lutea]MDD7942933.1 hypothetical protein [Actinomycetospora lutea]
MAALEAARAPWVDRLVDLHVLSEHGDIGAAEAAEQWMCTDPEARRVWDEVQRSCASLRGEPALADVTAGGHSSGAAVSWSSGVTEGHGEHS